MSENLSPILNNPYEEPILHYDADPNGNLDYTKILKGRRPYSAHIGVAPNRPDRALFGYEDLEDEDPNAPFINLIREEVKKWRTAGYPRATRVTRELLNFWFNNSERQNFQKLFFCQREAVETVGHQYLHAKGWYTDGEERLVYFHIGPKFGTVSKRSVKESVKAFRSKAKNEGASWLVILGFSFEDSINDADYNLGTYTVSKVRMHDDLMQDGLLKKDKGAGSFITIGEPAIQIVNDNEYSCHVEIRGLDIYDPIKDDVKGRSTADIAYWEIDDNYNEEQFIVREVHFCGGNKKNSRIGVKDSTVSHPPKQKRRPKPLSNLSSMTKCGIHSMTSAAVRLSAHLVAKSLSV